MQNLQARRKKLEQRKEKLKAAEQKLAQMERKKRTQHLIQLGGLVAKAGLDTLSKNTLYGALLDIKNNLDEHASRWTHQGGKTFNDER